MDSPLPIAFPRCWSRRSRPTRIPLQPWEIASLVASSQKLICGSMSLKAHAQADSLVLSRSSMQPLQGERDLRLQCRGIPNLPSSSVALASPSFESHQNLVKMDCMHLQRLNGRKKHVIAKLGTADNTDWIIVALPAVDRN